MHIFATLAGFFSIRGKTISLYKRGMAKAKRHDHQGALDDYTVIIGMPSTTADMKATVLYNRALVHVAAGDDPKGVDDLEAVLAMDEAIVNVKTMARQKLARMDFRSDKSNS